MTVIDKAAPRGRPEDLTGGGVASVCRVDVRAFSFHQVETLFPI
jgi:hypothetical protein